MDFIVVGGGIFGLFAAYHLINEGSNVIIVEQGRVGDWSRAAAGLVEYRMFRTNLINSCGYIQRYINMIRRNKALIKYLDLGWLKIYLKNYCHKPSAEYVEALKYINDYSRAIYRKLAEEKNDFEYSEALYYNITDDIESAIKDAKKDPLNPKFEIGEILGRQALVFHDVAKVSTDLLIERLLREIELSNRVKLINALAWDIDVNKGVVYLGNGDIVKTDSVIMSAGYWSASLGVPVAPFKGYGIRIKSDFKLDSPVSFEDLGIFIVPFSKWFKVTARFDADSTILTTPITKIIGNTRSIFRDFEIIDVAIGYRPCTPDGLPIIDRIGEKILIATGGCRLGWTQAPGAAKLVVDLALGRIKETIFKLNRFKSRAKNYS